MTIGHALSLLASAPPMSRRDDLFPCQVLDFIPHVIWVANASGDVEHVNACALAYAGLLPDVPLGWAWLNLLHPDDRERVADSWRRAVAAGQSHQVEYRLRTADGRYRWVLAQGVPVRTEAGEIARWIGTLTDIDDSKRAEEDLTAAKRQAEELVTLLDAVQEAAPVGIAFLGTDYRFRRINHTLAGWAGATPEEIIGRTIAEVVPELWPQIASGCNHVIATRRARVDSEVVGLTSARPSDRRSWLASYYPVLVHGELLGIGAVVVETTERRKMDEQLRQTQKMEAVGRIAGGVAHDFNNLLTTIIGYTELMLAATPEGCEHSEHLLEIRKAAETAAAVTRQLLTFSRTQVVATEVIDPAATLESMRRMLRQAIGEQVDLSILIQPQVSGVRIDPTRLQQVVLNLTLNAADATGRSGKITIECSNTQVTEAYAASHHGMTPGAYVSLTVTDDGVGMTEEIQNRLFEPFFTTKPAGKGTGLGLSTVYGIVKQASGHIHVDSEAGLGSTFKVLLPSAEQEVSAQSAPTATSPAMKGTEAILVVEDDENVRLVTVETLTRNGYTVLHAASADEAMLLEERFSGRIDLLLTDVVMPRIDGREMAARLLGRRPDLRVLFMSGYTPATLEQAAEPMHSINFLTKPFRPTDLLTMVRKALA